MKINKKLAIFDLDGTLFNTNIVNYMAYSEALKRRGYNLNLDPSLFIEKSNGKTYKFFLPELFPGISDSEMHKVHQFKLESYNQYLKFAIKNDQLFSLIFAIKNNYIIALVTSASKKNVVDILNYFNVSDYFDFIISQEDVSLQKPSPECFLKAVNIAQVGIEDTIIFEDSEIGLEAARLSGAKFLKVYGYGH